MIAARVTDWPFRMSSFGGEGTIKLLAEEMDDLISSQSRTSDVDTNFVVVVDDTC